MYIYIYTNNTIFFNFTHVLTVSFCRGGGGGGGNETKNSNSSLWSNIGLIYIAIAFVQLDLLTFHLMISHFLYIPSILNLYTNKPRRMCFKFGLLFALQWSEKAILTKAHLYILVFVTEKETMTCEQ